jgi:TolB protein
MISLARYAALGGLVFLVGPSGPSGPSAAVSDMVSPPQEAHLSNVRQLTFSGENAEAYFAFDGSKLIFQSTSRDGGCDQIYTMNLDGSEKQLVSTSEGRTTCSYFYPAGDRILYSSTHHFEASCPAVPDFSKGYVWPVYASMDIFVGDADGSNLKQLTHEFGYDAEATISPMGDRIVFTSMRDGDLDIYSMALDGSDVQRLTDGVGYDGGPFYSPDGSKIVYRASRPTGDALADYKSLLADGLIRPSALEIYIMDADGSNNRQITDNGAANFGPFWHPSGEKILFASNMDDPTGREFDIYMINVDGTGLEQITDAPGFDGFPVFSPDGKYLVFGSNRNQAQDGETNVFIAEWVD